MNANTSYNEVMITRCEICGVETLNEVVCSDCQSDMRDSDERQYLLEMEAQFGEPGTIWWFDTDELDRYYAGPAMPPVDPRLFTRLAAEEACA